MTQKRHLTIVATLALGFATAAALPAVAQTTPACDDATINPNPVYMAGSSAIEPTIMQLAAQIKAKQNISIVYNAISSCLGVSSVTDNTYVLTGTADYFATDASGVVTKNTCTLPAATKALIGVSDVFYDSCPPNSPLPATLGEWQGPVQSMLIVVPKVNVTTTAMSYKQAAAIWGCGAKGNQIPFTDKNAIQQRSATSGTQIMVARAIGVPETAFIGTSNSSSSALETSLLGVADPQTAIGILAADFYDGQRSKLNSVAFQGVGQTKAYYADSDATAVDKKNVRDGHYVIQGPVHFFTALTAGQPSATAQKVINWVTGASPIDTADTNNTSYISTVASLGDVPQCAMKVKINKDGGLFSPSTPTMSCGCFFTKAVNKLTADPAGCVACTSSSTCTGGKTCQTGYCE